MEAGRLRHKVYLQRRVETQDDTGEVRFTWVNAVQAMAAVRSLTGREFIQSRQVAAEITTEIRVRFRAGAAVDPTWRVKWQTGFGDEPEYQHFDIHAVLPDATNRREWLLMCSRRYGDEAWMSADVEAALLQENGGVFELEGGGMLLLE